MGSDFSELDPDYHPENFVTMTACDSSSEQIPDLDIPEKNSDFTSDPVNSPDTATPAEQNICNIETTASKEIPNQKEPAGRPKRQCSTEIPVVSRKKKKVPSLKVSFRAAPDGFVFKLIIVNPKCFAQLNNF